jgi:iron(III) transport system substrate-binding protein
MTGRRRKTLRAVHLLGAALAMALAACSASVSGSSTGLGNTPQGTSTQSAADLYAAAKKEGAVTWYSNYADDQLQPMISAFNKKYPGIKVNALRMNAQDLAARVLTEQKGGKFNVDVVEGESAYTGQLIKAGVFEPYTPPHAPPIPKDLNLPEGFQTVTYITTVVIAYNPTVLRQKGLPVPTSFEDLTRPAWKGQFSVNPSDAAWYEAMVGAMGHDKALQLAKDLGNNSPRLVESHTQALTQVQSGEPAATAMAYGYKASGSKKKTPDSVDFVNPIPLPTGTDLTNIVKNAPHPNAAKLLVDWLASQDGQEAIVDLTNHTSLRDDVTNDKAVWDPTKWTAAWSDPMISPGTFNTYVRELKTAFKAP